MKPRTILSIAVLAMCGSLAKVHADTKLLWRTPASGVTIVPNSKGALVVLGQVDVSAYDRFRLVAVARRPSNIQTPTGFGAPFQIELHIGEGSDDLGVIENGVFGLNPSGTAAGVAAHTERATGVFDNPVITTLLVGAVGPTTGNQQTVVDVYVYGERLSTTTTTSP
jgi:hypothetical protein